MTTTSQITHEDGSIGVMQLLTTGIILLVGAFVMVFCCKSVPLTTEATAKVGDTGLWALELGLYVLLAWILSRKALPTVLTLLLGMVLHMILGVLVALGVQRPIVILLRVDDSYWLVHLVNMLTICAVMLLPMRKLVESGFAQLFDRRAPHAGGPQQFSFATRPAQKATLPITRAKAGEKNEVAAEKTYLTPPEGFVMIFADQDIGKAYVHGKVILESVPEAAALLDQGVLVYFPLAFLVGQLPRATAWLTWEQIFNRKSDEPSPLSSDQDAEFRHRWIRLPAKCYVSQIPPELFSAKKNPPTWLRQSEVPQEHHFQLE